MKFSRSFVLASAIACAQAGPIEGNVRSEEKVAARQRMTLNAAYGAQSPLGPMTSFSKVAGGVSEMEEQEPKTFPELGAKRVKIRYGPYTIPSTSGGVIGKLLDGTGGMIWNMPHRSVRKPCTDCVLTYMHAGMEHTNGRNANTDEGLWLHHMVAINKNGRGDATCAWNPASLPHIDVGATAAMSERFFSSGNERTVVDVTQWAPSKVGYYVRKNDNFNFIVDLMNETPKDAKVYMTITWEYIQGKPAGFLDARPVWFDADQCGVSDVKPKSQTEPYVISSRPWKANFDGRIIAMGAHLHDGGTRLEIIRNNQVICDAKARYGEKPEYRSKAMGRSRAMGGMEMTHISSIALCGNTAENPDQVGLVKKGDTWVIKGYYDYKEHPGMLNGRGKQADVMAISIMYVAVPMR